MVMIYYECFGEDLSSMEASGKWISMPKVDGDNFKEICNKAQFNNGSILIRQLINRH